MKINNNNLSFAMNVASVLGGGSFANGAMTGAFIMLFNEMGRRFIHVTKDQLRRGRALEMVKRSIKAHGIRGLPRLSYKQAIQRVLSVDRADIVIGRVAGGIVLAVTGGYTVRALYFVAMRNPWTIEVGLDFINSSLCPGLPVGSASGATGYSARKIYDKYHE